MPKIKLPDMLTVISLIGWVLSNLVGYSMPSLVCSCMATYHPSWKLSKLDKPDMRDATGEVGMSS